jgi:type III secretory pathway component EscS
MIDGLTDAIRAGFGLVIDAVLPLVVVAAVTAVLVGLLTQALGIRDGVFAQIIRTLAVVLAIGMVVDAIAAANVEYASRTWESLGEDD